MKIKHIFSLAVLAVMTAACSSEDLTQQPASQSGQTLPFRATISAYAGTRGLPTTVADNADITATWVKNEQIALVHSTLDNENNPIVDVMTVDEVATDGKSATIAGTATYIDDNDEVYLVYVGHNDNMTNFQGLLSTALGDNSGKPIEQIVDLVFEAMLAVGTQNGTLGTISDNLDFRKGKSTLKQTNGWATFSSDAPTLSSQFAIWKLSLSDGTNAINATQLKITCGIDPKIDIYTITPTSETTLSTLYVLLPTSSSATYTFEASDGTFTYTYQATNVTLAAGKFYQSSITMTVVALDMDVSASGFSGTYDGHPHGITVTVNSPTGAVVKYGTTEGTYDLTDSPKYTDAGDYDYTVYYQVMKDNYNTVTGSATVTINKAVGSISYAMTSVDKTFGDANFTNELTKTGDGTVTYSSSDTQVAEVDSETGEVTIKVASEVTITATVADGTNYSYSPNYAQYLLRVTWPKPAIEAED